MDASEFEELYSRKTSFENVTTDGNMSPRQRFFATMDFQKPDRLIDCEFGYWNDTLRRWHHEGLPAYVDTIEKADLYFGFDTWRKSVPVNSMLCPAFEPEIISDDGRHQIMYDSNRVKCEVFSDGADTIPHYLDFPIKDKSSYREFKSRLQVNLAERFIQDVGEIGRQVRDRNYILEIFAGSTAGKVRDWMGFEGIAMGIYDQPELLEEVLEDLSAIRCAVAEEVTRHMSIDLVGWWEDIAFKTGPIVTPDFFINSCGPTIKKCMDIYRAAGTRYSFVDCDGDFRRLMPGWFNNGVNIMFPLEVAAGIHPLELRREHEGIRMMGGVDKTVLLGTRDDIRRELLALKPIVDEGGFIPHIDHRVQADVSYDNYLYYLEVKRELFGLPGKELGAA